MHIAACFIHPIKSCASLAREFLDIEPRGPVFDRRFMVVDGEGCFLTGRKLPRMVLVRAEPDEDGVTLSAPGMSSLSFAAPGPAGERMPVKVWGDAVDALMVGVEADAWLSEFLAADVRLAFMDDVARRPVSPERGRIGDEVSFADGYPLLLVGQSALDGLNARIGRSLPMTRFRPNLVVAGSAAHAEDDWRRIRIGALHFDVVKTCVRCVFTTVDPASGSRDADGEPLATLKTYRRSERGITFGVNMIARGSGRISVGDALEVLE